MLNDENFSIDEESIDPERVVTDEHKVADEFFCGICQGLLWKPKSCSSCQHLFCHKCIRTWLQINPTSCPFRCSPYVEKRPPPYIYSLLGRLAIRCRNASFGCTEILSYDALEQHETSECQYLTKRCPTCQQYILINEIDQHQLTCISTTVQCSICKHLIDRNLLTEHSTRCFQERLDRLIDDIIPSPDELDIPTNNPFIFPQQLENENWFIRFNNRLQRFLLALPQVNLIGLDYVVQTREQNYFLRIWSILRLIWFNKTQTHQILFFLFCFGIGFIIGFCIATYLFIQNQVEKSVYRGFSLIILLSGVICFGLPLLFSTVSDTLIILFTLISLILWSSTCSKFPLDYLRVYQNSKIILAIHIILLICFKISLLTIRFFIWTVPVYISAGCLAWIGIFITFHIRRFSINRRNN